MFDVKVNNMLAKKEVKLMEDVKKTSSFYGISIRISSIK
jgi:hypothetical protein